MKNRYLKMAMGLYLNYLLLGMINVIIASNMNFLSQQLNTGSVEISFLISAIGIGKLVTLSFSGRLSDKLGRKSLVVIASFLYVIFLVGIPLAPNYHFAFVFAIIAGICNSIMDSGTYPALIDAFPENSGSAMVLLKAFISIGATLLPILVVFIISNNLYYGFAFFVPAAAYLINGFFLTLALFPKHKVGKYDHYSVDYSTIRKRFSIKPVFWREGIGVVLIAFSSVALFMIIQTWIPTYGQEIVGLSKVEAVGLLSFYSIGGLISVLLLAFLLNKVIKPITIMVIYPSIAFITLLALLALPYPEVIMVCAFVLGLSTSGIFQLAVTIMAEFFPDKKGTSTAYVSLASSLAFIVIPFITGMMTKYFSVTSVFIFDLAIAILTILLGINLSFRYKRVFNPI
ncbi:MFS transporter [Neobacillus sp. YIM B06451]|uniref:MFS transporter n=1 Tax=Neobacillus sp. YIM B06451 TaxID=3070994 RepID=UPI0029316623|nr:MFS transporter [Neobacillus sp. YIM B06451]